MLELGYTPADIEELRQQPAARAAVHWGLLVKRVGPVIADGRPEMPVTRSTEGEKQHRQGIIARAQAYYDHLLRLIHVPDRDDDGR